MHRGTLFLFVSMFFFHATFASANIYDRLLSEIESDFDQVQSKEGRFSIVSAPMNAEYLETLSVNDVIDFQKVNHNPNSWHKTHALALSIVHGRVDLLKKFLKVVDDINDSGLLVSGYREWYTMAHLALDPQYPSKNDSVKLETRREILQILYAHGLDLNRHTHGLTQYSNPPLACGQGCGHAFGYANKLRVDALLLGADPSIKGNYYELRDEQLMKLVPDLLKAVLELSRLGIQVTPAQPIHDLLCKTTEDLRECLGVKQTCMW